MRAKLLSFAAVLMAAQGTAHAQEAQDTEADEIVVTAQKREERLLDVPISITAVNAEQLSETGGQSLSAVQDRVPGLFVSTGGAYGASPIGIRGATGVSTTFGDEPVAIYLDGVYRARAGFLGAAGMLDVGSIEIVRGPQGTLQGRNATSGAVLVRSALPDDEFGGFVRLRAADPTAYRIEAAITGPIAPDLLGRFAVSHTDEEGWATNLFNGENLDSLEDTQARASFMLDPTAHLSMRLSLDYQHNETNPAVARWAATCFNANQAQALVLAACNTPTTPLSGPARAAIADGDFNLNHSGLSVAESWGGAFQVDYAFDGVDLVAISGYSEYGLSGSSDSDGFGQIFPGDTREGFNESFRDSNQFSQEVRLQSSGDRPLSWILGAYYFHEFQDMAFAIVNNGVTPTPAAGTTPVRTRTTSFAELSTDSWALFGDATWRFSPQWALTAGVRYTQDEKEFDLLTETRHSVTNALISSVPYVLPAQESWSDTSYRVKLTFEPTDDLLVYASYSTGFKAGGFNAFGGIATAPSFDPETLASSELGVKLRLPSLRGYIAAAVYSNIYEGLQIRAGVPSGGVAIFNAADSQIDGFEFEASIQPFDGLTLAGNVAYADARYTDFPNARDLANVVVDATGNRLSRAPEWQYFLSAEYEAALGADWTVTPQLTYSWRDRIYHLHTNQDSPAWQGDPLENLGARLTLEHQPTETRFGAYGTNLTDDRSVTNEGNTFSYPLASFNRPLTVGVFLEREF